MNIIIKKVRVVAAPEPPFVGTRIRVRIGDDGHMFAMTTLALADGCSFCTVDWGDGTVEQVTTKPSHTYDKAGEYEIRLTDEVMSLAINSLAQSDDSPVGFFSNGTRLQKIMQFAFFGCGHLVEFDTRESGLYAIARGSFLNCTSLTGELYFPKVYTIMGPNDNLPFKGCTGGITKIHFASEHEAQIKSTTYYRADPTLGSGTATCVFDL